MPVTPASGADSDIAVVGLALRVPGAGNPERFWERICNGVDAVTHLSDEDLRAERVPESALRDPNYVNAAMVLEGIDLFDAGFFGYNPREAEVMDPQHRFFLECSHEALERACCDPERYPGRVGVFAGSAFPLYFANRILFNPRVLETTGLLQAALGNEADALASTVSYKLNLQGPSLAVQTFCSTSLVAVHLACQSLLNYESDLALAGGVAITDRQRAGYLYQRGGILSPDGCCRSFDAQAQGSIFGSGVGVLALERLEDALKERRPIYAVIKGSAVNNDGALKAGYTAPALEGQAAVVAEALAAAGATADTIDYVECHGTGTRLGDSIEIAALTRAFRMTTPKLGFCAIGSVKPNIGHLDRASGVVSLIKACLALKHGQIPPSLHFESPNPDIDFVHSPFVVNTKLREWRRQPGRPRRAGVDGFGLGGTNVHVVLEEAPEARSAVERRPWQVLVLSGKTPRAVEDGARELGEHLRRHPETELADVAYTLQLGRTAYPHRRILVCRDREDAIGGLCSEGMPRLAAGHVTQRGRALAYLFAGDAPTHSGTARELYETEAFFRAEVDRCCTLAGSAVAAGIRALAPGGPSEEAGPTAIFVVAYALGRLLGECGLQPDSMLGCGPGEYAAACLAGMLTVEDALRLLSHAPGETVRPGAPTIPYISPLTGTWITPEQVADPEYWARHAGQPARVEEGIRTLAQEPDRIFLELGLNSRLTGLVHDRYPEREALACLPSREHLMHTAGHLWLMGCKLDWERLHHGQPRRFVSLPTYRFQRERYWIEARSSEPATPAKTTGKNADISDWFFLPGWKLTMPPRPLDWTAADRDGIRLVLTSGDELGARCVDRLREAGRHVVTATPGRRFTRTGPDDYVLQPAVDADYRSLIGLLPEAPRTILHLWSASSAPATQEQNLELGMFSLLFLVKALSRKYGTAEIDMTAVGAGLFPVTHTEELFPEKATLPGVCKVIAQEYLSIRCRCIDMDPRNAAADLPERLLAECFSRRFDPVVALRGRDRWVQCFEPARLDTPGAHADRLRRGGAYLITGGLGGVGLILARYLAREYKAKLVLTGRSGLPAKTRWAELMASRPDAPESRKIAAIQECESAGGDVLVASADVSDERAMRSVVAQAVARFGTIHGVIHAAGISDERSFRGISEIGRSECDWHFQPKVHGLSVLERVLDGRELDFCLLMSSISSVLGGLGFSAYTAANCYMDAFAQKRNQSAPGRWLAVNWDTWQTRGAGQGGGGRTIQDLFMTPAEGCEAFRLVVSTTGVAQIVLSTGDLDARLKQWVGLEEIRARQAPQSSEWHARPPLPNQFVAPQDEIQSAVADLWKTLLGIAEIGIHDSFFDLGGHSLLGTQFLARLRAKFSVDVPLDSLFKTPTVAELAEVIKTLQWTQQGAAVAETAVQEVGEL